MKNMDPTRSVAKQSLAEFATSIEAAAESLSTVLDPSRCEHLSPVSPAQLRVLLLLQAKPALNVNGLAEALRVGASSASRLCDRLEALGLISRVPDPRDRREMQLPLTHVALAMLNELRIYRRRALETVLAEMSISARQELSRSLTAFSEAADARTDSAAAGTQARLQRSA
jgi:DNA-binding MarR family transcriptional regulator